MILVTKELAAVLHQQAWLMANSLGLIETRRSSHSKLATALSFDAAKAPGEEKKKKKHPKTRRSPPLSGAPSTSSVSASAQLSLHRHDKTLKQWLDGHNPPVLVSRV